ncbi:MAG: DUF4956 domain-containing protein [Spirochaetales bacterium]|uniref:DUF4956 domain-containing protein n=1 Tax=Candidatus Thalassospirochaeta sargassi TaxID=3119039 RepID=A0AAJ1IGW2_9SPIO|nr:DUF4956 domain-containing protein [Spirochaetales bacterium]
MENIIIFGIHLINMASFQMLVIKFLINLTGISILIFGIYYPVNKNTGYLFNFFIFNILIFFVSSMLSNIQLETGFAFGLFAIFSILRYRTEAIPIKEMTFMFISIIMATINSTVTIDLSYFEIIFADIVIILITFIMERLWLRNFKPNKKIKFEMIELIHHDRKAELIKELEKRLGQEVNDVEIESVDFLRDTAVLKVYMG